VLRDLVSAFIVFAALQAAGGSLAQPVPGNTSPTNQTPDNQPPVNQSPATPQDPAAVVFNTETGMVLHAVKPGSEADYEAAIVTLKEALVKAEDAQTRKLAAAWRIYKATEPDAKSSVIYVHVLDPVIPGVDYRPSLWLDKLLAGAPADLLTKYRDAFAVAPTKLSLTEVKKP
jgi:hypothetical protein